MVAGRPAGVYIFRCVCVRHERRGTDGMQRTLRASVSTYRQLARCRRGVADVIARADNGSNKYICGSAQLQMGFRRPHYLP